jgi:signal transduction histidine kinase
MENHSQTPQEKLSPQNHVDQDPLEITPNVAYWLFGHDEMSELIRSFDWSKTALGQIESWPHELKFAVNAMLGSGFPSVIAWGPEHIFLYNQKYAEILGSRHPGALGQPMSIAWADDWPTIGPIFNGVLQKKISTFEKDKLFRLKNADGTPLHRWFTISHIPIINGQNEVKGNLVTLIETTERKKAEDDLLKAINVRDDFISIASHELRTPLSALYMQLQLLDRLSNVESSPVTSKLSGLARGALNSTRSLVQLLDDLLDVTRIRVGKLTLNRQPTDLSQLVQRSLLVAQDPSIRGQNISTDIEPGIIADVDPVRMTEVCVNLFSNAIKYGNNQPITVKLKHSASGNHAILEVSDQGIGIPGEMLEKIFERFQRAVSGNNISGLGLGLYISKQIMLAHGGSISAKSEVGKGTVFTAEIPLFGEHTPNGLSISNLNIKD